VPTTLATAADGRYGYWLLNMLGSVQANSPLFERVVAYDLGLTPFQRRLLDAVRGVEVATVPPFVPHWRQGRTWKTWIWKNVEGDTVVWLDAGLSVLRPLTEFLRQIEQRGYFVVSQGIPVRPSMPPDYQERFGLDDNALDHVSIAAGILGFARGSRFYDDVVVPTYDDASAGLSLGFSAGEVEKLNHGLDRLDPVIVRDCPLFRHEQTLLCGHFYRAIPDPHVNDVYEFGGWRSRHDHPTQVIWSHRRRGDFAYLPHVRYRAPLRPFGVLYGWWYRLNWWRINHSWLFKPSTYTRKAARLLRHAP
jgi:hypothetical protein